MGKEQGGDLLFEEIKTKVEATNYICDLINAKIKDLEGLLAMSNLGRCEFEVSPNWGTMRFFVYWCPVKKRVMAFTEDGEKPLLEHRKPERMEFYSKWNEFLGQINESL